MFRGKFLRDKAAFLLVEFMFFRQIQQHGDNFSYIIADDVTREAAVVDSSFNAGEITRILTAENLKLKYVISTHGHSDHTAGNEELRSTFGAKTVAHKLSRINADFTVDDGDVIRVGTLPLKVIHTPGHTPDSICLLVGNKLLTGDTLFVGECGRTDLPGETPEACTTASSTSFQSLVMMWRCILGTIMGQSLLQLWVKKSGQTTLYSREASRNSLSS